MENQTENNGTFTSTNTTQVSQNPASAAAYVPQAQGSGVQAPANGQSAQTQGYSVQAQAPANVHSVQTQGYSVQAQVPANVHSVQTQGYSVQAQAPANINPPYTAPYYKPETKQTLTIREKFGTIALATLIYAVFFAICLYRNPHSITYPLYLIGSINYVLFVMKQLSVPFKKDGIFQMIAIGLLGVSTCMTMDPRIINFNKLGSFLLFFSFLLHQFFEDKEWDFGRYLGNIIQTVFCGIGELARPFKDMKQFRASSGKKSTSVGLYIGIGVGAAVPMLIIVWALLASADKVFGDMTKRFFGDINGWDIVLVILMIVFMYLFAYCTLCFLAKHTMSEEPQNRKRASALVAISCFIPITLLYLVFCYVQVRYLFMGEISLEGITYAEYAREGFFQLLAVCIINLILVLLGKALFVNNKALKIIMTIMSLCTYVMIYSSGMRMILYIKQYYFTFLRIFVLFTLVLLAVLLTGVILAIYADKFPLFRYCMVVTAVLYICFSFSRPDYLTAKWNLSNVHNSNAFFEADGYNDWEYLMDLSADAAPAIAEYAEENNAWGAAFVGYQRSHLKKEIDNMSALKINFSLLNAQKVLRIY